MPLKGEAKKAYNAKYFAKHKDDDSDDEDNIDYSVVIAANTIRKMGFGDDVVNKVVRHGRYNDIIKMTKEEIESWLAAN